MKKIFTLLAIMLLTVTLYAYPNQSKLSITSTGNSDIRVMIDGNKYRSNNNVVMISNLKDGYHSIKVYQLKNGRGANPYWDKKNAYQLIYNNSIYIKPQYHVDITINRFGKAFIDEQFINGVYEEADDEWGDNSNNNESVYHNNNAMSTSSFEQFKQSLKNESFDNTRLNMAKQVIAANYFTSAQVKELVGMFSFDNSKLDLAKFAWKYTTDKENYFIINDVFNFSNSKDELIRFIQANK